MFFYEFSEGARGQKEVSVTYFALKSVFQIGAS
jgi:hypothetical protein